MAALSDADMVTKLNECLQAIALGQSYEINGRVMTRANIDSVVRTLAFYEARVRRASGTPSTQGQGLASFGDPT